MTETQADISGLLLRVPSSLQIDPKPDGVLFDDFYFLPRRMSFG